MLCAALSLSVLGTAGTAGGTNTLYRIPVADSSNPPMVATNLSAAALSDGAVCLDGTPAFYYFRPGSGTGSNKWYLHHKGGGWCESLDDCLSRSLGSGGSSKGYPPTQVITDGPTTMPGPYSRNQTDNPMMHNWNTVWMPYCDGASFSGSNATATVHKGAPLHFRGFRILRAIIASLLAGEQAGPAQAKLSDATDVVVSGESAGGLAAILHLDTWCDAVHAASPQAKCVGLPDSGFFMDYQDPTVPPQPPAPPPGGRLQTTVPGDYRAGLIWVHEAQNATAGLNAACVAAHPTAPWMCMFSEHSIPVTRTPMFAMQSTYDAWQVAHVLKNAPGEHFAPPATVQVFGNNLTATLTSTMLETHPENGVFLDSCLHHCAEWNLIRIDGDLISGAFQKWYDGIGVRGSKKAWIQGQPYPCVSCCKNA